MFRTEYIFILILTLFTNNSIVAQNDSKIYKMCVPKTYYQNCLSILEDSMIQGIKIECIGGRDRFNCLELIQQGEADVMSVDIEDIYMAYQIGNQDFKLIAEFRTKDKKKSEFHYEAVALIKKTSKIKKLNDLKGLKSCHAGFHRNVGYRIPLMKLVRHGLVNFSRNSTVTAIDRELKALSEFFPQSCLTSTWYSQCLDIEKYLRRKYTNLCAICENPKLCKNNDLYSGYDGAIHCLDKGDGEIAFTKTSSVKKYFGLTKNDADCAENDHPEEFQFLCEDGSRKPITSHGCSWVKIPWKGYIANGKAVRSKQSLENLLHYLEIFFQNGIKKDHEDIAEDLLIESNLFLHKKNATIKPKEYLKKSGYKEVIEWDGAFQYKIRLCIETEIELDKCKTLSIAAFSRGIRPQIECYLSLEKNCGKDVEINGKADVFIVAGNKAKDFRREYPNLSPLLFELFNFEDLYVAVIDPKLSAEEIKTLPIKFDKSKKRSRQAATLLSYMRGERPHCTSLYENTTEDRIQIVHTKDLNNHKGKMLLCMEQHKMEIDDYQSCMMEVLLPNFAYTKKNITNSELKEYTQVFSLIQKYFGQYGKYSDVFDLFSEFKGNEDVIFHDNASGYIDPVNNFKGYFSTIVLQYLYEEALNC
ncbi:transferrin-like [Condylostylus longicornis]|uniref:transferrin-like n=1 Tax=Condylostylus longicornis TaxID=2530218 RepID=UPI00244E25FE|nr:transferrin-like [Condylostylus longicornis]